MKRKGLAIFTSLLVLATGVVIMTNTAQDNFSFKREASADGLYSLVFSSQNPVISSQIKTQNGNTVWVKADSSSGITWNNGNNLVAFDANGYIQNLSGIAGIRKIHIELVSGKLGLFYDYKEPSDLETPMYDSGKIFTSSGDFVFDENIAPSRIRLVAFEDSLVVKIVLSYDCHSTSIDANVETINEHGFENSYIDCGSIGKYAFTSFVSGENNVASKQSKRSLKLTFKNTKNNHVSFNTDRDTSKELIAKNPDFSNAIVTLKAKFSSDILDHSLSICAVGSGWADSSYQIMNRDFVSQDGWSTYSFSFSDLTFNGINNIIRFNVKPLGIDSTNKDTASILLDEIRYHYETKQSRIRYESVEEGLENIIQDASWENTFVTYNNEITFGLDSRNSICLKPGKKDYQSNRKWFVSFNIQADEHYVRHHGNDFTSGALDFVYKPVGEISNKNQVQIDILTGWESEQEKKVVVSCNEIRDGWYKCHYDLSQLGLSGGAIRLNLGFGASNDTGKIYIDNIKKMDSVRESWALGLENLALDEGMSKYSNNEADYNELGSETSFNSFKQTFKATMPDDKGWQNQYASFFNLDSTYKKSTLTGKGKLIAKFKLPDALTNKKIRLNIIDDNWKVIRYKNLVPTEMNKDWYSLDLDLEDLYLNWPSKTSDAGFDPNSEILKFGFGFEGLNDTLAANKSIYIDDIFYTPNVSSTSVSNAVIWQAYSTETVKREDDYKSERIITNDAPLYFADAKNGIDSTQLMIKATANVSSFNFKPGKLINENGEVMSPQCFEVLVEKYQNVKADSAERNNAKYGWQGAGYYPDATVPIDRIIACNENNINSGDEQGLWINCAIPKNQSAGTYVGNSLISIDGVDYLLPTKVKVYNVTLEDTNHSKTCFTSWDDILENYLSGKWDGNDNPSSREDPLPKLDNSLRLAYYNFITDRRISPDHCRNYEYTVPELGEYASFAEDFANYIMPNKHVATYRLPLNGDNSYESIYNYFDALITKNIEEWDNGNHVSFFDKIIVVLNDEPKEPVKLPDDDSESKQMWDDVKTTQTNFQQVISDLKSRFDAYPELKKSFIETRNVLAMNVSYDSITGASYTYKESKWSIKTKTGYYPNYFNSTYIDTPCPTFDRIDDSTIRDSYRSSFDQMWFYGCVVPTLPYPSYHLDTQLLNQRLIKWMQYDYDIEGEIYFSTHMFAKEGETYWVERDIWNDAKIDGSAYGDGALLYPGDRYNIVGPISTTRMENIRNANEDLELFYLFDKNIEKYNARVGQDFKSSRDFMSLYFNKLYDGTKPNVDNKSSDFMSYRDILLGQLEYCY